MYSVYQFLKYQLESFVDLTGVFDGMYAVISGKWSSFAHICEFEPITGIKKRRTP
jgi:hypothetical protein